MNFIDELSSYAGLDYEISLCYLYGKQAVRMKRTIGYLPGDALKELKERVVVCEQIYDHDKLKENFASVFSFMSENIQKQIETGEFYEPS